MCNVSFQNTIQNFSMDLTWYNTLNKPAFNPPSEIFAPVWTVMYTLIFISFVLFLNSKKSAHKTPGLVAFIIQILLNFSWSPAFFLLHSLELSFVIIILLLISTILTIIFFYKVSKPAGIILIPYLIWVCFAAYLNYSIMILN